jgi:hypothetical protein
MRKLNKIDKSRLSELIDAYLNPTQEYKIEDNGGVTSKVEGKKIIWLIGMGHTRDFHEITLNLIQKVMEKKASIVTVQSFCSDAMSHLMTTNDRSRVIKSIYMAHLIEPDPDEGPPPERGQKWRKQPSVEVEIREEPSNSYPHPIRILQGMSTSEQIAQLLNNSDCIVMPR